MDYFPQISPPEPCIRLSSPSYVLHALPIVFFWSPEWYLVRSTEHKARCSEVFSIPLSSRSSYAQISSSEPYLTADIRTVIVLFCRNGNLLGEYTEGTSVNVTVKVKFSH
jgi:hypothetical protein